MLESKLFNGLNSKESGRFIEFSKPLRKTLKKGTVLCDEGSAVNTFGVILSGRLKGAKYRYDGTLDLIDIYTENDMVNLETVCSPTRLSPIQISAMDESELLLFNHKIINTTRLIENEFCKIHENIIQILANENIKKLYKIDVLYKKALRERIMVYLRHMETHLNADEFHIRMDREQFAQYLGVNRSALSHELSLMRKAGIIEFRKDYFKIIKDNH